MGLDQGCIGSGWPVQHEIPAGTSLFPLQHGTRRCHYVEWTHRGVTSVTSRWALWRLRAGKVGSDSSLAIRHNCCNMAAIFWYWVTLNGARPSGIWRVHFRTGVLFQIHSGIYPGLHSVPMSRTWRELPMSKRQIISCRYCIQAASWSSERLCRTQWQYSMLIRGCLRESCEPAANECSRWSLSSLQHSQASVLTKSKYKAANTVTERHSGMSTTA